MGGLRDAGWISDAEGASRTMYDSHTLGATGILESHSKQFITMCLNEAAFQIR